MKIKMNGVDQQIMRWRARFLLASLVSLLVCHTRNTFSYISINIHTCIYSVSLYMCI